MNRIVTFFLFFLFYTCTSTENKTAIVKDIIDLSNKIEKEPGNTTLLLERANYNIEKGNLESAIFDLKQCIAIDSLNLDFQYNIAEVYFSLSKLPNAKSEYPKLAKYYLEKILSVNTNDYMSHALFGELLLAYMRYEDACKHLVSSLHIEYNQAKTHVLLGYALKQLNKEDQAINSFRNAINVDPDFKEAYIQLGQIYHLREDTLAVIYYNNALRIDSTDIIVLYNKAVFFQSLLKWNQALEAYAELHKIKPFHADGHYNIGFIHMELGLYDIAVNNFSDAIYSRSNFFEAYYSRGICFETLGNIMQASSDYKRAIDINPGYLFAKDALKELEKNNRKYN